MEQLFYWIRSLTTWLKTNKREAFVQKEGKAARQRGFNRD
jgi:hypothetical protein